MCKISECCIMNVKKAGKMKKKIFVPLIGMAVLSMCAYAGYRTYGSYVVKEYENDLFLSNVEALAVGGEADLFNRIDCYNSFEGEDEKDATRTTNRCSPCGEPVKCRSYSDKQRCRK